MQQIKNLRLDVTQFAVTAQFAPLGIKREIFKKVYQMRLPSAAPTAAG